LKIGNWKMKIANLVGAQTFCLQNLLPADTMLA
jgi:hypothetical protein